MKSAGDPLPASRPERPQKRLGGEDLRQLEDFLGHLRRYYGIPADQPVFPKRKKTTRPTPAPTRRSDTAINAADHPWRVT